MKKLITLILLFISIILYAQNTPGEYTVKNAKINTSYSDFGTAFFGKDKVVFASPKLGITFTRDAENSGGQPYLDLFIGDLTDEGGIIKKEKMPGDINTKYHEGMVSFSKDMKTVYFSANWYIKKKKSKKLKTKSTRNIQIFKATINEKGEWTNLKLLPFNSTKFSSGHPALNRDDTKLYFVSDRPESIGKTDIYVIDIYNDSTYSEPRNLGPKINTIEREMFPFMSDDNILYFSSNGHPGSGELDVFASKIFDNTVSEPISLETPVNSEKDDFAYIIDDSKHKGYFSSNRKGGKGDDDIYSFTVSPPIHIECKQAISGVVKDINTQEILPGVKIVLFDEQDNELDSFISKLDDASFSFDQSCDASYKIVGTLEGYLPEIIEIKTLNDLNLAPLEIAMNLSPDNSFVVAKKIEPNQIISGVVRDQNTQEILPGAIVILLDEKGNELQTVVSNKYDASFSFDQPYNPSYKIIVSSKGYLKEEIEIKPKPLNSVENNITPIEIAMNLSPDESFVVYKENTLNINTIYFDFDKYYIRSDAEFELDKIVEIMKQNPNITIDVGSHADSRGKNAYNMELSNNRAKSTTQYLVDKGIALNRISGKGYGEEQLATDCPNGVRCSEYRHQLNRRSEFFVANASGDITIKSNNILNSDNFDASESIANSGAFTNYNFNPNNNTVAYTVQIGAFRRNVQSKKYDKLTNLFNHRYDDGFNRYFAGKFKNSYEAKKYMRLLKKRGFEGAFVVGLKGNDRF